MRFDKQSNYVGFDIAKIENYISDVDADLQKLFLAFKGRVRLGNGEDGAGGENFSGEFQQFTSHATPDTEFSVTHTIGAIPVGQLILWQDKAGSLYQSPTSGTDWTATQVFYKCNVSSVTFLIFLLK